MKTDLQDPVEKHNYKDVCSWASLTSLFLFNIFMVSTEGEAHV